MGRDCCGCATEVQLSSNYNLVSRSTLLSVFPPTFKNKIEKARVSRFAFSSVRTLVARTYMPRRDVPRLSRACPVPIPDFSNNRVICATI